MEQILVSGSAGFIGGYVVEELLKRGYAVIGLDNFSNTGRSGSPTTTIRITGSSKAMPGTPP